MSCLSAEAPAIDYSLEGEIDNARLHLLFAKTPNERRMWWDVLKQKIEARSPGHVEALEIQRGLR